MLPWLPGGMEVINAFYSGTLFLRGGGHWMRVLAVLFKVVNDRLVIRSGRAPPGARRISEVIVASIAEGVGGLGEHNETLQADFNKLITVLN